MNKATLAFLIFAVPLSLQSQSSSIAGAPSSGSSAGMRSNAVAAPSADSAGPSTQSGPSASSSPSADSSALPAAPSASATSGQAGSGQRGWGWLRRPKHEQPVMSTAFGFNYLRTNMLNNKIAAPSTDRLGWYGSEQWNPWTDGGFRFEAGSAQSYHRGNYAHGQSYVLGPALALPYHYQPMLYVGGGATRESLHSAFSNSQEIVRTQVVNWNTTLVGGIGVIARFHRRIGIQFLPEYLAIHQPNGDWTGSVSAKVGFVFNGYGNR